MYEYVYTPNLGTDWDINFCTISCPVASVGFINERGLGSIAGYQVGFAVEIILYIGNVAIYSELVPINNILIPLKETGGGTFLRETAISGNLQFPQTPRAFGGQSIAIGLRGVITINGHQTTGKLTALLETEYAAFLYLGAISSLETYPTLSELLSEPNTGLTIGYTLKDYHRYGK